ncbi:hypothetical protein KBC86_04290 [Candidatus Gracilibacteria bacterium]|nr:hypothetical protein [Candidatus Gracilibacteria bacterium]
MSHSPSASSFPEGSVSSEGQPLFGAHHMLSSEIHFVQTKILNGPKTIEIAGKKILAMPLESMKLSPEQQIRFKEAGGLLDPTDEQVYADENHDKMMQWTESFEGHQIEIDGKIYRDFEIFKQVYQGFPEICSLTEKEAREVGIYPDIYYRNHKAREWFAKMLGGHLAHLDEDSLSGELSEILTAATGNTPFERLASIGQAPFGGRYPILPGSSDIKIHGLGQKAILASGSLRRNNKKYSKYFQTTIPGFIIDVQKNLIDKYTSFYASGVSSVLVFHGEAS